MFSKHKYKHKPEVAKTPISIGQALLILIDNERQCLARVGEKTSLKLQTFETLYLTGAKTLDDQDKIFSLIEQGKIQGLFEHYVVPDFDADLIDLAHGANEDKSRRYFETHLAYRTLEQNLDKLSYDDLNYHYQECVRRIPRDKMHRLKSRVLDDKHANRPKDAFEMATYDTLVRLKSSSYLCETMTERNISDEKHSLKSTTKSFTDSQRLKIRYLTNLVLVCLKLISLNNSSYPINIYSDPNSLFSDEKRGRKKKNNFGTTTSTAGILKNYMTVPRTDIAYLKRLPKPEASKLSADIKYFLKLLLEWSHHSEQDKDELKKVWMQCKEIKEMGNCTYQLLSVINKHIAVFRDQTDFFVKVVMSKPGFSLEKEKVYRDLDILLSTMRRLVFCTFPNETNYDVSSEWQEMNFSRLVHPHVNSISGVLLIQLRIMTKLASEKQFIFSTPEKMKIFFRCYLSSMLYTRGGHSLNEFMSVFEIPEVRECFRNHFTLNSLFYKDNQNAFQAALTATIEYNRRDLLQARVNSAIVFSRQQDEKIEEEPTRLGRASKI